MLTGIDHIVIAVNHLDEASAAFDAVTDSGPRMGNSLKTSRTFGLSASVFISVGFTRLQNPQR